MTNSGDEPTISNDISSGSGAADAEPTVAQAEVNQPSNGASSTPKHNSPPEPTRIAPNITVSNRIKDYTAIYPPDQIGKEAGPNARAWLVYLDEAEQYDKEMLEGYKSTIDVLLIFAGLFSAVVTAFLVDANHRLQPDPNKQTVTILTELVSLQYAVMTNASIPSLSTFNPTSTDIATTDIWCNCLWVISLPLALAAALIGVFVKEWLVTYASAIPGNARDRVIRRHYRFLGLQRWKVSAIVGLIHPLLHVSLLLFFAGLSLYLLQNTSTFTIATTLGSMTLIASCAFVLLPIFSPSCPYKTPLTKYLYELYVLARNATPYILSALSFLCRFIPSARKIPHTLRLLESSVVEKEMNVLIAQSILWLCTDATNPTIHKVIAEIPAGLPSAYPKDILEWLLKGGELFSLIQDEKQRRSEQAEDAQVLERSLCRILECVDDSVRSETWNLDLQVVDDRLSTSYTPWEFCYHLLYLQRSHVRPVYIRERLGMCYNTLSVFMAPNTTGLAIPLLWFAVLKTINRLSHIYMNEEMSHLHGSAWHDSPEAIKICQRLFFQLATEAFVRNYITEGVNERPMWRFFGGDRHPKASWDEQAVSLSESVTRGDVNSEVMELLYLLTAVPVSEMPRAIAADSSQILWYIFLRVLVRSRQALASEQVDRSHYSHLSFMFGDRVKWTADNCSKVFQRDADKRNDAAIARQQGQSVCVQMLECELKDCLASQRVIDALTALRVLVLKPQPEPTSASFDEYLCPLLILNAWNRVKKDAFGAQRSGLAIVNHILLPILNHPWIHSNRPKIGKQRHLYAHHHVPSIIFRVLCLLVESNDAYALATFFNRDGLQLLIHAMIIWRIQPYKLSDEWECDNGNGFDVFDRAASKWFEEAQPTFPSHFVIKTLCKVDKLAALCIITLLNYGEHRKDTGWSTVQMLLRYAKQHSIFIRRDQFVHSLASDLGHYFGIFCDDTYDEALEALAGIMELTPDEYAFCMTHRRVDMMRLLPYAVRSEEVIEESQKQERILVLNPSTSSFQSMLRAARYMRVNPKPLADLEKSQTEENEKIDTCFDQYEDEHGILPLGWERHITVDGRPYYMDHNTQTVFWDGPSPAYVQVSATPNIVYPCDKDEHGFLPYGWERHITIAGRPYYVDHQMQTTTWNRPLGWPSHGSASTNEPVHEVANDVYFDQHEDEDGLLPFGWGRRIIGGRPLYVDHNTRTITWNQPAQQNPRFREVSMGCRYPI